MDKFFNSDNMVMRTLSKIFDIGWLTLIYLVFCIPIVTVGSSNDIAVLCKCQSAAPQPQLCMA